MIKYISILICFVMLFTGCSKQPNVQLANPMQEKNSLDEINDAADTDIQKPQAFIVKDEKFFVINTADPVADYRFSIGENNYTLRASKSADDISGVYGDTGSITHWYKEGVQYSLFCEKEDDKELRQIAAEQSPVFYPVVEEIGDGYMTVIANEQTPERASSDKFTVKTGTYGSIQGTCGR